jgi:hypothetical protein
MSPIETHFDQHIDGLAQEATRELASKFQRDRQQRDVLDAQ